MTKLWPKSLILTVILALPLMAHAQIKGLFEKEEPMFHATVQPTATPGAVWLIIHYTHSKAPSLKASFWLNDRGPNLTGNAPNRIVADLYEMTNRRADTIVLDALRDQHFYTLGVDYQTQSMLGPKFATKVIEATYRYEYRPGEVPAAPVRPAPATADLTPKSATTPTPPCVQPDLLAWTDRKGHCGNADLPSVVVQCRNCHGQDWSYTVFYRTDFAGWKSLGSDTRPKTNNGNAAVVETICHLPPGFYYFNVTARGQHCTTDVSLDLPTPVAIPKPESRQPTATATRPATTTPKPASKATDIVSPLPDQCAVSATAAFMGGTHIRGYVALPQNSECAQWQPRAIVRYVHPGHRDQETRPIALLPGQDMSYEIPLDQLDRARQIHTLQVITYITPKGGEPIPVESFWLKATEPDVVAGNVLAPRPTQTPPAPPQPLADATPGTPDRPTDYGDMTPKSAPASTPPASTPADGPANTPEVEALNALYDKMLEEEFETVNVKATNPNCNQIQELRTVFVPNDPEKPLYVSWLSPRCCQEEGCKYTVWAGPKPTQLRLLVEGSKRGAVVSEILQGMTTSDLYIEVEVKTPHGNRKAAYVMGEGAFYGIEDIIAFRDRTQQPTSDPIPMVRDNSGTETLSASTDDRPMDAPAAKLPEYKKPNLPITGFSPCVYRRETTILGEQPIDEGDLVTIQYNYSDPEYRFTLYHLPPGATEWSIAPGSSELQPSPAFDLVIAPYTAGKYVVMAYKPANKWGCLASPLSEAIEIKVAP